MRFTRTLLRGALFLTVLALTAATRAAGQVADGQVVGVDGRPLNPFRPAGTANVIFFVATDCPISNSYAPEIQRVCREYGARGIGCSLIYEDVDTSSSGTHLDDEVRKHLKEYRYAAMPAAIDRSRTIAKRAKASVTPQAVVIDRAGQIRYRGRIDNFYAALGKPRQQVTEHDLSDALDAVLAGRPVPKVETTALGCYIVDPVSSRK